MDDQGLRALLEQTETSQRSAEKEKSLLITQLTEQNQRLTSQLKDVSLASKVEEKSLLSLFLCRAPKLRNPSRASCSR